MNDENVMIKMPKEMKDQIKEKAKANYQTVSDYIRSLIVKDLKGNK